MHCPFHSNFWATHHPILDRAPWQVLPALSSFDSCLYSRPHPASYSFLSNHYTYYLIEPMMDSGCTEQPHLRVWFFALSMDSFLVLLGAHCALLPAVNHSPPSECTWPSQRKDWNKFPESLGLWSPLSFIISSASFVQFSLPEYPYTSWRSGRVLLCVSLTFFGLRTISLWCHVSSVCPTSCLIISSL